MHCFFLTLITVFYMFSTMYPYLSVLFFLFCFYFHLLFLIFLATRHILQFTIFDSISLQPARIITEIRKYFIVHDKRKNVALIITKSNALILIIFGIKYDYFLPSHHLNFFLAFVRAKRFFRYHILVNILLIV